MRGVGVGKNVTFVQCFNYVLCRYFNRFQGTRMCFGNGAGMVRSDMVYYLRHQQPPHPLSASLSTALSTISQQFCLAVINCHSSIFAYCHQSSAITTSSIISHHNTTHLSSRTHQLCQSSSLNSHHYCKSSTTISRHWSSVISHHQSCLVLINNQPQIVTTV